MNRFTVVWSPAAEAELARLWIDSSDRQAITRTAALVERELRFDPLEKGEYLIAGIRVLYVPPLRVCFEVLPQDCQVRIALVGEIQF